MKIYKNFNISNKFKNAAIAIGNFDGFHLGHQKVIKKGKNLAKKYRLKFGLLVFHPLPVMFFNKKINNFRIDSLKQKIENSKKLGIDFIIIKKFDKNFSKTSAENFISQILHKKLKAKLIFISQNFKFGKNRIGNINLLKKKERLFNYKTKTVDPLTKNKFLISSTLIRKNIKNGKIHFVNKMLGRPWTIEGIVKRGEKRGRKIGFPTCNLELGDYVIPKTGVYAS